MGEQRILTAADLLREMTAAEVKQIASQLDLRVSGSKKGMVAAIAKSLARRHDADGASIGREGAVGLLVALMNKGQLVKVINDTWCQDGREWDAVVSRLRGADRDDLARLLRDLSLRDVESVCSRGRWSEFFCEITDEDEDSEDEDSEDEDSEDEDAEDEDAEDEGTEDEDAEDENAEEDEDPEEDENSDEDEDEDEDAEGNEREDKNEDTKERSDQGPETRSARAEDAKFKTVFGDVLDRRLTSVKERRLAAEFNTVLGLIDLAPDMALTKCRKILETALRVYFPCAIGGLPQRNATLEQLLEPLRKEGKLPRKIEALCAVVQHLGNFGTHASGDELGPSATSHATHEEAFLSLLAVAIAYEWLDTESASRDLSRRVEEAR